MKRSDRPERRSAPATSLLPGVTRETMRRAVAAQYAPLGPHGRARVGAGAPASGAASGARARAPVPARADRACRRIAEPETDGCAGRWRSTQGDRRCMKICRWAMTHAGSRQGERAAPVTRARPLALAVPATLRAARRSAPCRLAIPLLRFPPAPARGRRAARLTAIPRLRPHRGEPPLAPLQETPPRARPIRPTTALPCTRICSIVRRAHGRGCVSQAGQVSEGSFPLSSEASYLNRRRPPYARDSTGFPPTPSPARGP